MTSAFPTVLLFTPPEHSHANVCFATSYELALAGATVYISSLSIFKPRVTHLQELVARHTSRSGVQSTGSIIFHEFKGLTSYADALKRNGVDATDFPHPPGVSGAMKSYVLGTTVLAFPRGVDEHLAAIETAKEAIATIKPDVVVLDGQCCYASDACKLVGQKFMILFQNAVKDAVVSMQPNMAALWKYPVLSSGFPFPLKWWQIPLNMYLIWQVMTYFKNSPAGKEFAPLGKADGVYISIPEELKAGVKCVCAGLLEIDFPFAYVPESIIPCGPLVVPFDPIEETEPKLTEWLDNGPTVVVNLGSLAISNEKVAREMAGAFRILLDHHDRKGTKKIQVFWKIKANDDVRKAIDDIIGKEIEEERIKVVAWVDAEPVSVLQHPNVVCTVHHGGANSYFEGIWSGLPHIVLPVWFDTYEYAHRVEYFNIGVYGNKDSAPGARAEEFGRALVRVTSDTAEAAKFRTEAKRLKEICQAKGNGRRLAALAILKEAGMTAKT